MLGVDVVLGRTFRPGEDEPGRGQVAILSDSLWQRRFGRDPDVVGERLLVDGQPLTIIGVLPAGFYMFQPDFELWLPWSEHPDMHQRNDHSLVVVARLAAGVSRETAQAEMDGIAAELARRYPDTNEGWGAT